MSDTKNYKKRATGFRLVLRSAVWTLIAMALIAIGYFGAEMLFG